MIWADLRFCSLILAFSCVGVCGAVFVQKCSKSFGLLVCAWLMLSLSFFLLLIIRRFALPHALCFLCRLKMLRP
jgi:hypothetical protein